MDTEEKDLAMKLALSYCQIQRNEDLISLAEKIYNFFKETKDTTKINAAKYRAIMDAISYCQVQRNESLFLVAEKIYQFLIKEE